MAIQVIKRSGLQEPFNAEKIKAAVIRAGASNKLAEKIARKVETRAYEGIKTKEIYRIAFRILDKEKHSLASIYDLKRAIMRLGPAGYSFETYLSELLKERGHKVMLRQMIRGLCVEHEIDVISEERAGSHTLIECKYHNEEGMYTGLKPTMYTYARYLDMCEGWRRDICKIQFESVMLATNTKFSHKAIEYAKCKNMKLLGWRYPKDNGINTLIENKKSYPLTILRKIDSVSKKRFSDAGIMMIKDLLHTSPEELSMKTNIHEKKLKRIMDEAHDLISM